MSADPFMTTGDTEAPELGPVVAAQFDSDCGVCDLEILEGQDIRAVGAIWAHAECAEAMA